MILIALIGTAKALFMVGRRFISGRQALGVEYDMRNRLYSHLLRLSFGFYDRHQTGQLMSRATVDLQTVRFFLGYGLIFFFQHVLTLVGVTAVMFWYDWRLALIALAITPILVGLAYRYSHISHPILRDVQQRMADVATVAEENIVGVHAVKSFAQEPAEQRKFERRSEAVFGQSVSDPVWGKETRFGLAIVDLLRRRGGAEDRGTSRVIRCVAGVGVARDRRWLWTPRLRSRLW